MLGEKDLKLIDEMFAHRLNVILESAITPNFDRLAEGQQTLLETLAPKSRVEDEIALLKSVIQLTASRSPN